MSVKAVCAHAFRARTLNSVGRNLCHVFRESLTAAEREEGVCWREERGERECEHSWRREGGRERGEYGRTRENTGEREGERGKESERE